jgi:hypothetical protein
MPAVLEDLTQAHNPPRVDDLESGVRRAVGGRIRELHVTQRGGGLVLSGWSETYYAKQLAQHYLLQAAGLPLIANDIQVLGPKARGRR